MDAERPHKRPRLDVDHAADLRAKRSAFLSSLSRSISPPPGATPVSSAGSVVETRVEVKSKLTIPDVVSQAAVEDSSLKKLEKPVNGAIKPQLLRSPFQLLRARGLPSQDNIDTISLHDILGDPLIKEAWIFNFCFNVNWTMRHFDADVRELVKVKIVHGSWRRDDRNRIAIEEHLKTWKNVEDIKAYLPDQFGTHHSKMIIIFKHDDTAQVIIHTANMLEVDWDHMTQAVWRSPILSLEQRGDDNVKDDRVGSGGRFKSDLLRYLQAYGVKLKSLTEQLSLYDFSTIRAALIASVPSHAKVSDPADKVWGHLALSHALSAMRQARAKASSAKPTSHLVSQVSSIATLPQTWLSDTIYKSAAIQSASIIFPTPTDLRNALTGYATGGSIHTKASSAAHLKQISLLRPQLNRWGTKSPNPANRAGRHLIPPHIKTYISFTAKPTNEQPRPDIEWTLVTSANLSTQAWGTAPKIPKGVKDASQGVVHVQSFEIGVLVWPELFVDQGIGEQKSKIRMVPIFGHDMPDPSPEDAENGIVIGMRMPYDLPLTPYEPDELPWSPSNVYRMPDSLGESWG
ncbi:hypothetical protein H2198_007531 [Neophaeococcomyces mojaviensis]|uniref:Uncharacterized protein n=1 Tax=Neophaeococcomyces mojaviensis TaxID=3383035 RepID=A0ACC2ZZS1_9EURO|nr:hypothetical protein H2198_007531 [Knufia sp. JES_112]